MISKASDEHTIFILKGHNGMYRAHKMWKGKIYIVVKMKEEKIRNKIGCPNWFASSTPANIFFWDDKGLSTHFHLTLLYVLVHKLYHLTNRQSHDILFILLYIYIHIYIYIKRVVVDNNNLIGHSCLLTVLTALFPSNFLCPLFLSMIY